MNLYEALDKALMTQKSLEVGLPTKGVATKDLDINLIPSVKAYIEDYPLIAIPFWLINQTKLENKTTEGWQSEFLWSFRYCQVKNKFAATQPEVICTFVRAYGKDETEEVLDFLFIEVFRKLVRDNIFSSKPIAQPKLFALVCEEVNAVARLPGTTLNKSIVAFEAIYGNRDRFNGYWLEVITECVVTRFYPIAQQLFNDTPDSHP